MDSNILDPTLILGILYYDDRKALLCLTAVSFSQLHTQANTGNYPGWDGNEFLNCNRNVFFLRRRLKISFLNEFYTQIYVRQMYLKF